MVKRVALIGLCGVLVLLPNLRPQTHRAVQKWEAPATSARDMAQDTALDAHADQLERIERHLDHTDANVEAIGRELSDQEGSGRVIDWALGTVVAAALGISLSNLLRRGKESA